MKTLERGPRKRGKKLYKISQILFNISSPYYIWRTGIEVEDMEALARAGLSVRCVRSLEV